MSVKTIPAFIRARIIRLSPDEAYKLVEWLDGDSRAIEDLTAYVAEVFPELLNSDKQFVGAPDTPLDEREQNMRQLVTLLSQGFEDTGDVAELMDKLMIPIELSLQGAADVESYLRKYYGMRDPRITKGRDWQ